MAGEAASSAPPPARPVPMERGRVLLLAAALAGYLLINMSAQFVGSNLADIQGGVGATADEGSWLTTAYTMALLCGVVCATPLVATFGIARYMFASSLLFALAGLAAALAPPLPAMIGLRAIQGLAAGGLGPIAFVATFTTMGGPRLPLGLSLLALFLLLPATLGPAAAGFAEAAFGWRALFVLQGICGGTAALLALLLMPRAPLAWQGLRRDWAAIILLALALAASLLVLGQGTRRYWFDSMLISWSLAIAVVAWCGFLLRLRHSPMPILDVALVARRSFLAPLTLNLLFRTGFATTAFLIPQFLAVIQGYRPLELAWLLLWAAVPQLIAFPMTLWLLERLDRRAIIASGLVLFGAAALLASHATSLVSADQLRLSLVLSGVAQVLFLVPNLVAGAGSLKPTDGPTASLLFNATTLGGASLGVALATEIVTERHKLHFAILAETAGTYGSSGDQLEALTTLLAARVGDHSIAASQALATLASVVRREAWVLAFNDAFLVIGALLVASAAAILLLQREP